MTKANTWFECVQVVERNPAGKLLKWYDGDQRATENEARDDKKKLQKEFPGTEYVVLEKTIQER